MQKTKRIKAKRTKAKRTDRVTGDALLYFFLHSLISVLFFFLFTVRLEVYEAKDVPITFFFTSDFWDMVMFQVLLFIIISNVIGRITAYFIIRAYFYYRTKKSMKRWTELNRGINKFSILIFLLTALTTSIIYSLGIIAILQDKIFDENTLLTLIATYILFKIGCFFFWRWLIRAKT